MPDMTYTLTRDDEEIELSIEYEVAPYFPARTWGPPEDCEPASGGEVESLTAFRDGQHFDLTEAEDSQIERFIYDHHEYGGDDAYGW